MEFTDIVGKLIGLAFFIACLWLEPKVDAWFAARTENEKNGKLLTVIAQYVRAADQMFKAEDPTGEMRNNYVKEQLISIGVEITSTVNAYIESAVLGLKEEK